MNVSETGINPDPIVVHVNDIVIWAFTKYQTNDVVLVDNENNLLKYIELSKDILPRRYLSHAFGKPGMYHFASPSFDISVESSSIEAAKGLDVKNFFFFEKSAKHSNSVKPLIFLIF